MKFLTFADVHHDKKNLQSLAERARSKDINFLLCVGDLSVWGRGLRESLQLFSSLGKPFYFIPGNHEEHLQKLPELFEEFPQAVLFHEKALVIGDYVLLGHGGGGFSQEDTRFRKLARTWYGQYQGKKIILATHMPPYGTKVDELQGDRHVGHYDYRQFIERIQPKIAISGHLHETAGKVDRIEKTKIVNPGWKGMVIELA